MAGLVLWLASFALGFGTGGGRHADRLMPSEMTFRSMREADLELVRTWLGLPHVARWYLAGSTLEQELDELRQCIAHEQPTYPLVILERGRPIGWCQWYLCSDYPDHAAAVDAEPGEIGWILRSVTRLVSARAWARR